jgi:hypothetical protein
MPSCKKLATLLGVLAALASCAPAGAVVGGAKVDPASVPWFVSVGSCGGTLVAPARALTAAHCVAGNAPANLTVEVVGTAHTATRVAMHPGWRHRNGTANFLDDVAIVEFERPVGGVPFVKLGGPEPGEALILGRGRPFAPGTGHSEAEMLDGTLRTAPLETIGDAACARLLKGYRGSTLERFDPRMRCSIDADGRAPLYSGCNGDSGGPLWTGTASAPVQLGVVSWGGDRCGADHLPSVFADVALYRAFITDPSPVWAPSSKAGGRARIAGTSRPGRTLTCAFGGRVSEAGVKLVYTWKVLGRGRGGVSSPRRIGGGRTYTIAAHDRGFRLGCFVDAANRGGYVLLASASRFIGR